MLGITYLSYLIIWNDVYMPQEQMNFFFMMHSLNLGIHEAGHFLFFLLRNIGEPQGIGEFMYILGGSLVQWLAPLLFVFYFLVKEQKFAAFTMIFWFALSLLDSVPYIADATALTIPLLGENGIHDWNYLLFELNALYLDKQIAMGFRVFAMAMLFLSVMAIWLLWIRSLLGYVEDY